MTVLSLTLNFPFCYRNRKTFGIFGCCCNFFKFQKRNNIISTNIIYNYKFFHPFIVSITRFIWDIIIFLLSLVILTLFFIQIGNTNSKKDFSNVDPQELKENKGLLLPNICFSSIHKIPIILFLPFINDAYYYNNNNKFSSLENEQYKRLFFTDDYNIKVMGNLIDEEKTVKMIQYNVKIDYNYVTILSIKGTSYNKDMLLDIQLYFSSILLNLLNSFSVMTQKDSLSFQLIEYSLNIPYRIFFKYLMIDNYLKKLKKAYDLNKYTFYSKVVIIGHSLGGGLAKLFGRIIGKQAISLSGPGINAFHSLWDYKGSSENFGISAIDLVPDKDLVPRVEISGGTVHRILCIEGVLDCHSKEMSLCEVLIMCRNPNYETYCKNVTNLTSTYIENIKKSSELNNKKDYLN
jgi:lipase ATG15